MQEKGYRGVAMEGRVAHWYDARARRELDVYQALARRMAERLPARSTVLEVAPGPGRQRSRSYSRSRTARWRPRREVAGSRLPG